MKCIVATHNAHKLAELERILRPLGFEPVTDTELGLSLPEVEETGTTFADNAFLKANSACAFTGLPAVADDSGLMVDALHGAPGVYSARYAGENATDVQLIDKVLRELSGVPEPQRTARFMSSICCVFPSGDCVRAEGTCEGRITETPHGESGFGYDPVFAVGDKTFAEMTAQEKDAVSHRGNALRLFAQKMEAYIHADK